MRHNNRMDFVFEPAHNWDHTPAPTSYKKGEHVLATCNCGVELVGHTERNHGRLDAVVVRNGAAAVCTATGRDHSSKYAS